jgi:hypothetical protein
VVVVLVAMVKILQLTVLLNQTLVMVVREYKTILQEQTLIMLAVVAV